MPTANHTPMQDRAHNPCTCCGLFMGCGKPKVWPTTLPFRVSVAGSCPGASPTTVSGIATAFGSVGGSPAPSCDDLTTLGCESGWPYLCKCNYYWQVADADIPLCGPYIQSVLLECVPSSTLIPTPPDCPHLAPRYAQCHWKVTVVVARFSVVLHAPAFDCDASWVGCHGVQDCDTCTWAGAPGAGPLVCCDTCPPCTGCPTDMARLCALGAVCCGTDGCGQCPDCPIGPQCTSLCEPGCLRCWMLTGASTSDASCYFGCTVTGVNATYIYQVTTCDSPDDVLGLNPLCCPPDDKNTGDFYLKFGCSPLDYVEFACDAGVLASSMAARRVAALTDAEVSAALAAQLSLGA